MLLHDGLVPLYERGTLLVRMVRAPAPTVRQGFELRYKPRTYEDIELVHSFINELRTAWGADAPDYQTMDRYLMMFGKNVAPPV